jgi:hypothetical protein
VGGTQLPETTRATGCQVQAHEPMIGPIDATIDETGVRCPVDEPDRAVMAKHQFVSDLSDRRRVRARVAADREEQLVLRRRNTDGGRLVLAPAQELA